MSCASGPIHAPRCHTVVRGNLGLPRNVRPRAQLGRANRADARYRSTCTPAGPIVGFSRPEIIHDAPRGLRLRTKAAAADAVQQENNRSFGLPAYFTTDAKADVLAGLTGEHSHRRQTSRGLIDIEFLLI
eukprot:scaffold73057_cov42-Prasinocladus_malaysianus.AAC.1